MASSFRLIENDQVNKICMNLHKDNLDTSLVELFGNINS